MALSATIAAAVDEVVRRQVEVGVDLVSDKKSNVFARDNHGGQCVHTRVVALQIMQAVSSGLQHGAVTIQIEQLLGVIPPGKRPKSSVREGGPAYTAFTRFWKWGGARADKVKDFMHFSPTGE